VPKAKTFYSETLGPRVFEEYGMLWLYIAGERDILVYPKPGHTPASFAIFNFPVADIGKVVDELTQRGVRFEATTASTWTRKTSSAAEALTLHGSRIPPATSSPCFRTGKRSQMRHTGLASSPASFKGKFGNDRNTVAGRLK
jgi:hypothetical protein